MNWELHYEELTNYAARSINRRGLNISPAELVAEVYLLVVKENRKVSVADCKKLITKLGWKEKTAVTVSNEYLYGRFDFKVGVIENDRACKVCHEVKPLAAFSQREKDNIVYNLYTCKSCESKIVYSRYRARVPKKEKKPKVVPIKKERKPKMDEETRKQRNRDAKRKWYENNREEWNAYLRSKHQKKPKAARPIHELWKEANKRYQAKQKELLTDVYIRTLLKGVGKEPTAKAIIEKREAILKQREEKRINEIPVPPMDFEELINQQKRRNSEPYYFITRFSDINS